MTNPQGEMTEPELQRRNSLRPGQISIPKKRKSRARKARCLRQHPRRRCQSPVSPESGQAAPTGQERKRKKKSQQDPM